MSYVRAPQTSPAHSCTVAGESATLPIKNIVSVTTHTLIYQVEPNQTFINVNLGSLVR